jgi:GNAT superfamily N-acetyltransferase
MVQIQVGSPPTDPPRAEEVRALYAAAASRPPLNELPSAAALFASLYASSLGEEEITAATARDEGRLVGFAYGHPWLWADQQDPWADQLRARLGGDAAAELEGAFALSLLARDPDERYRGLGREILARWLRAIGPRACWLLTTDVESPARQAYGAAGFTPFGHGPDAPDGNPGLVLLKPAGPASAAR